MAGDENAEQEYTSEEDASSDFARVSPDQGRHGCVVGTFTRSDSWVMIKK